MQSVIRMPPPDEYGNAPVEFEKLLLWMPSILLCCYILNAMLTLWAYWRIRKNALEFIDIKLSMEK
jgi:hypothetical protein